MRKRSTFIHTKCFSNRVNPFETTQFYLILLRNIFDFYNLFIRYSPPFSEDLKPMVKIFLMIVVFPSWPFWIYFSYYITFVMQTFRELAMGGRYRYLVFTIGQVILKVKTISPIMTFGHSYFKKDVVLVVEIFAGCSTMLELCKIK